MNEEHDLNLIDASGEPAFFGMMPKMAGQDLSPGAYKLYGLIKDVAGEDGACWMGQERLRELLGTYKGKPVSVNSLRKWREELVTAGYITAKQTQDDNGDDGTYTMRPVNRWAENRARFDAAFRSEWLRQFPQAQVQQWLATHWRTCRQLSRQEVSRLLAWGIITEEQSNALLNKASGEDQQVIDGRSENDPGGDQYLTPKNNQTQETPDEQKPSFRADARPDQSSTSKRSTTRSSRTPGMARATGGKKGREERPNSPLGEFVAAACGYGTLTERQNRLLSTSIPIHLEGEDREIIPNDLYDTNPEYREYVAEVIADLKRRQAGSTAPLARDAVTQAITKGGRKDHGTLGKSLQDFAKRDAQHRAREAVDEVGGTASVHEASIFAKSDELQAKLEKMRANSSINMATTEVD